jgi:hypothetical protein
MLILICKLYLLTTAKGQMIGRIVGARDWSTPAARTLIQSLVELAP